jgi:hypothetical protein
VDVVNSGKESPVGCDRLIRYVIPYRAKLLTVAEKNFIGSEAAGITSSLTWETEKFTVIGKICKRYTLPILTVREWMKKVIASVPISSKIGRPMDEEAIEKFQNTVLTRRDARNAVPLSETLTLMGAGVEENRMREGKRGAAAVSSICVTTQKKLFKE